MYSFEMRRTLGGFEGLVYEITGRPLPIVRVTGKVKTWTRWGARRLIKRLAGPHFIEIVSLEKCA